MENGAEFGNYVNGLSLKKMKVAVLDEIDAEIEENLDKPEHTIRFYSFTIAAVSIPLPDEIDNEMEEDSDKPEDVNDVSIALDRNNFENMLSIILYVLIVRCYVLSDANHTCYVVTVYGIRSDAVSRLSRAVYCLFEQFFVRVAQFMRKGNLVMELKKQTKQPTPNLFSYP
ncbi:hypothetical protein BC332_27058 [Capsicum chinense]|nr:hypothetical protein BC332_27058 [Capsicum chinense]